MVRDQPQRTMIHLLNLNIERVSSFQDAVHPANNVKLKCRVPLRKVRSVKALTADLAATAGKLGFTSIQQGADSLLEVVVPRLEISTLLVVEP